MVAVCSDQHLTPTGYASFNVYRPTYGSFDDRSFATAGPLAWNGLRLYLRPHINYEQFKWLLKIFSHGSL